MARRTQLLTDEQYLTLNKYCKAAVVSENDRTKVHILAQLYFMQLGCHEEQGHKLVETVKLTALGRRMLHRHKILNNPFRRMFYRVHSILST